MYASGCVCKFSGNLVFFLTAGITALLFLKLARQWPDFAISWEKMERQLTARHNPHRIISLNLALKFKIMSIVVMLLALGKSFTITSQCCLTLSFDKYMLLLINYSLSLSLYT
jgi:hypothetical protein